MANERKVTIGVLVYNHEDYISECLESVVEQHGNFKLRIVILNDKSNDKSDQIIKNFIKLNRHINIKYEVNTKNLGAQKSIFKILGMIKATKPEYWSYIEGDDKYLDDQRTQKHLDIYVNNNDVLVTYNKLLLIDENSRVITKHEPKTFHQTLTTDQLAAQNHIGSFCATFYSYKCFEKIDFKDFEGLTVYDWFFNIWLSQFGKIYLVPEYLSGYRQHSKSVWSSLSQKNQFEQLISSIDKYNERLFFLYDEAFQQYKRNLINRLFDIGSGRLADVGLIYGNLAYTKEKFATPQVEYILENYDNSVVIVRQDKSKKASNDQKALIMKYKRQHPEIAPKIIGYNGECSIYIKTLYALSLEDAYGYALHIAQRHNIPLIFQILPQEEATIDSASTRRKLRKIFRSVNLRMTIVHNEAIKDYLVSKKFCTEYGVALIPSTVTSLVFGEDKAYTSERMESYYFQAMSLLHRSNKGDLKPLSGKAKIYIIKAKIKLRNLLTKMVKSNKAVYVLAKKTKVRLSSLHRLIMR